MPVPIFEANYTEDIEILDMLLQEPKGYEGYFDGFEILWKVGGLEAQYPWQSVVNLTDGQRVYEMDGVETSMKYAVTARGLVLPDSISEMADPLVFETMDAGLSPFRSPTVYSYAISSGLSIQCVLCLTFPPCIALRTVHDRNPSTLHYRA